MLTLPINSELLHFPYQASFVLLQHSIPGGQTRHPGLLWCQCPVSQAIRQRSFHASSSSKASACFGHLVFSPYPTWSASRSSMRSSRISIIASWIRSCCGLRRCAARSLLSVWLSLVPPFAWPRSADAGDGALMTVVVDCQHFYQGAFGSSLADRLLVVFSEIRFRLKYPRMSQHARRFSSICSSAHVNNVGGAGAKVLGYVCGKKSN